MWKQVQHHPNYEVSDEGLVRRIGADKPLQGFPTKKGYLQVILDDERLYIHILVANHFVQGKDKEHWQVDHKDKDVLNNNASNLRWVTDMENQRNKSNNRKVKNETLNMEFDCMAEAGEWLVAEGRMKNLNSACSSLCAHLRGKSKSCGRFVWRYLDD